MKDKILRRQGVRDITGLPDTSLDRLEAKGEFPHRRKIADRSIGWSANEVQSWVDDRLAGGAA